MKQNGVNVASDFLTNLSLSGTRGGLVLITCDDPSGISSTNEEDARHFALLADVPLLEPSTPQEALEMTCWAFTLSEKIQNIVIVRSVSRLSHTRSNVMLGELSEMHLTPRVDLETPFHTFPVIACHEKRHEKLKAAEALFIDSLFNRYHGPDKPELIIMSSGCAVRYATEAVDMLDLYDKVGVLKLGTVWPLPVTLIKPYLATCDQFLFAEDVDPFLEDHVKSFAADIGRNIGVKDFFGKASGHLPGIGELSPKLLLDALIKILGLTPMDQSFRDKVSSLVKDSVPQREFGFCPGCPHRGSYYAIKTALAWDGRGGFVSGDIGCYTMGIWPTGFNQVKSVHAMGSGIGLACGYGKLERFGFDQPVVTVCGDSTFFHAGLPALVNAKFNSSDILLLILDNSATAMTGFQPHPGTGTTAIGEKTEPVDIEALCQSLDISVAVSDPYDLEMGAKIIHQLLQQGGPRVLIMQRKCALVQAKQGGFAYDMHVNPEHCLGEACGCGRYCTRIFRCPGLIWDNVSLKAEIDEVVCVGCGICSSICPQGAIEKEEKCH
ncbi:MAG: indolepyruvate ferredoxin oxidoreductase subunit alpha [Desulfobacterales bacterium]|nr:indolepyruvate ferredoxin oxidoreductase subunit alpha [Desulfobacterales bacterium]